MSGWNPFGEDNFSKLTEEELIDREFDMLRASKGPPQWLWSFYDLMNGNHSAERLFFVADNVSWTTIDRFC